jgi:TRAP-type mannitol/chloroaromatic compound transport system substrate-binding protein
MTEAQTITQQLLEDNASGNQQYRTIYDAYKKAREDAYKWFGTAEMGYADFAFPRMGQKQSDASA